MISPFKVFPKVHRSDNNLRMIRTKLLPPWTPSQNDCCDCLINLPASSIDSPRVSTVAIATCVQECHRLVGRSRLQLFEIGTRMRALGATFVRRLLTHPHGLGVGNIGALLARKVGAWGYPARYPVDVRACATPESIAWRVFPKSEKISTVRTESWHHSSFPDTLLLGKYHMLNYAKSHICDISMDYYGLLVLACCLFPLE